MALILTIFSYIFWVALALSILVFVHELGHFLAARLFGMRVDAFSIGFPPTIFKKKKGDTEYRIGATPLGGYVSIAGMVDENLVTDGLESDPEPDEYRAKPIWQRAIVISAGVIFNLIFALIVFIGIAWTNGRAYIPAENVQLEISEGSLADEIGFETGDQILSVNGERLEDFDSLPLRLVEKSPPSVDVIRGEDTVTLEGPDQIMTRISRASNEAEDGEGAGFGLTPHVNYHLAEVSSGSPAEEAGIRVGDRVIKVGDERITSWDHLVQVLSGADGSPLLVQWKRPDSLVQESDPEPVLRDSDGVVYQASIKPMERAGNYQLGIGVDKATRGVHFEDYSLGQSVVAGAESTWDMLALHVRFFGQLFRGRESVRENVAGPLMIAKITKEAADTGGASFWRIVGMLSVVLAIVNILPIPALDGGHLMFLLYEAVARRKPSLKVQMAIQQIGMVLLLVFIAFVIFNDAVKWFG